MLTTREAAELLDITPRRVQELIKNGALEARKASGVWLIDKDSVNARLRSVTKTGGRPRRGHGKRPVSEQIACDAIPSSRPVKPSHSSAKYKLIDDTF